MWQCYCNPLARVTLFPWFGQFSSWKRQKLWRPLTVVSENKFDCCLTRNCLNPKNSTQSATSSIFQERQEGAPSESKVGSNPLSNLVGVFLELLISPSAIFVYRGNSVLSQKSLRYQISNLDGEGWWWVTRGYYCVKERYIETYDERKKSWN